MSILRRSELLAHFGTRVQVTATIANISYVQDHGTPSERTVRIQNLTVQGEACNIAYVWLKLGPTASDRLNKLFPKLRPHDQIRFEAEVCYYQSSNGESMSLELLSGCEVCCEGRWRLLNRNVDRPLRDGRRIESRRELTAYTREREMDKQRPIIEQLSSSVPRRDKTTNAIFRRFFVEKQPVTDGQLRHAQRLIGG